MANHPYNRWVGTFSRPWGEWRICNLQCSLQQSCTVCGSWDQVWDWVRWRRCDRYVVVVDTSLVSSHLVTRARYVQDNIVLALDLGFEQESENIRNLCREFILVTGGSSFTQLSTVHCPWGTYITNRVVRVRLWSTWHYFIEKKKKKGKKKKEKKEGRKKLPFKLTLRYPTYLLRRGIDRPSLLAWTRATAKHGQKQGQGQGISLELRNTGSTVGWVVEKILPMNRYIPPQNGWFNRRWR